MMDPTDLNDPAKAEAFLRETIAGLTEDIAKIEAGTAQEIREFEDRYGDDPDAVRKYTLRARHRCVRQLDVLHQHREQLIKVIAQAEIMKLPPPIIMDEGHLGKKLS